MNTDMEYSYGSFVSITVIAFMQLQILKSLVEFSYRILLLNTLHVHLKVIFECRNIFNTYKYSYRILVLNTPSEYSYGILI